jgi:importin subunit beta-1
VVELSDDQKNVQTRQMAGLLLKNALSAKDEQTKQRLASQWLNVSTEVKGQVKAQTLKTIHSSQKEVRHVVAQVFKKIYNFFSKGFVKTLCH